MSPEFKRCIREIKPSGVLAIQSIANTQKRHEWRSGVYNSNSYLAELFVFHQPQRPESQLRIPIQHALLRRGGQRGIRTYLLNCHDYLDCVQTIEAKVVGKRRRNRQLIRKRSKQRVSECFLLWDMISGSPLRGPPSQTPSALQRHATVLSPVRAQLPQRRQHVGRVVFLDTGLPECNEEEW